MLSIVIFIMYVLYMYKYIINTTCVVVRKTPRYPTLFKLEK